jgi:hypothetical protein
MDTHLLRAHDYPQEPEDDERLAEELRQRGYVVYKKRPRMRGGKVRLRDGTVLLQTTVEEVAGGRVP